MQTQKRGRERKRGHFTRAFACVRVLEETVSLLKGCLNACPKCSRPSTPARGVLVTSVRSCAGSGGVEERWGIAGMAGMRDEVLKLSFSSPSWPSAFSWLMFHLVCLSCKLPAPAAVQHRRPHGIVF